MPLAYIQYISLPGERPVDPGWGLDEGARPGQGLPGRPEYPSQRPPWQMPPGRPDQGLPYPGRPVDPGWGVGEAGPDQGLPVYPLEPEEPPGGEGEAGQLPSHPPGTIWPPLPPGAGFHGKAVLGCYCYYNGKMNHHFVVVTLPEVPPQRPGGPVDPGWGIPEGGGRPDQGLPGRPEYPSQRPLPSPPGRPPPVAGQPLPRPPMAPPAGGVGGTPPPRPTPQG